jgi:hypothetical protein
MSGTHPSGRAGISRWARAALCAGLLAAPATALALDEEAIGFERTPPRLSSIDGEVSFIRPGAGEWAPAQVNTPLAAGDQLYTGEDANLEIQVAAGAFVRAADETQLALTSLEPDFLQLRVTAGRLSLDLRSRRPSQTIEIDTPNAAFTVEHNGYYRVEVDGEITTFTSRRGGRATVTPASGDSVAVAPSEQVVVTGTDEPQLETWAAPELDDWDRWNYARTDEQMDAVSARYVPSGVYGVDDLDHHGDWRIVPTYGAVWVPRGVAVGWAPYSTGRWLYDPYYGWTWVDHSPWGWAPYHYGRWVFVSGHWGWCPGRLVVRPYYAPALVAFFGGGLSFSITGFGPHVGWVALGWGEPLVPWWGPVGFRGAPHWAGWGGPRIINNVVVKERTVIRVRDINVYQNAHVRDAIVAVERDRFGRRSRGGERDFVRARADRLEPLHGELPMKPDRTSLVPAIGSARRPPREVLQRPVVATRKPRPELAPGIRPSGPVRAAQPRTKIALPPAALPATPPPARVVSPPRSGGRISVSDRPPFGRGSEVERRVPPPVPRFERPQGSKDRGRERVEPPRAIPRGTQRERQREPQRAGPPGVREPGEAPRAPSGLPGEPANVIWRHRGESRRGAAGAGAAAPSARPSAPPSMQPGPRPGTPAQPPSAPPSMQPGPRPGTPAQPPRGGQPGRVGGGSRGGHPGGPRR